MGHPLMNTMHVCSKTLHVDVAEISLVLSVANQALTITFCIQKLNTNHWSGNFNF